MGHNPLSRHNAFDPKMAPEVKGILITSNIPE